MKAPQLLGSSGKPPHAFWLPTQTSHQQEQAEIFQRSWLLHPEPELFPLISLTAACGWASDWLRTLHFLSDHDSVCFTTLTKAKSLCVQHYLTTAPQTPLLCTNVWLLLLGVAAGILLFNVTMTHGFINQWRAIRGEWEGDVAACQHTVKHFTTLSQWRGEEEWHRFRKVCCRQLYLLMTHVKYKSDFWFVDKPVWRNWDILMTSVEDSDLTGITTLSENITQSFESVKIRKGKAVMFIPCLCEVISSVIQTVTFYAQSKHDGALCFWCSVALSLLGFVMLAQWNHIKANSYTRPDTFYLRFLFKWSVRFMIIEKGKRELQIFGFWILQAPARNTFIHKEKQEKQTQQANKCD